VNADADDVDAAHKRLSWVTSHTSDGPILAVGGRRLLESPADGGGGGRKRERNPRQQSGREKDLFKVLNAHMLPPNNGAPISRTISRGRASTATRHARRPLSREEEEGVLAAIPTGTAKGNGGENGRRDGRDRVASSLGRMPLRSLAASFPLDEKKRRMRKMNDNGLQLAAIDLFTNFRNARHRWMKGKKGAKGYQTIVYAAVERRRVSAFRAGEANRILGLASFCGGTCSRSLYGPSRAMRN